MSKTILEENNEIYKAYLDRHWFASWKLPRGEYIGSLSSIEVYLTSDCNLGCTYCYLNRHENKLYPPEIRDPDTIINNLGILIDWLIDNKLTPNFEFYSGSPLSSELGFRALDTIYNKYSIVGLELRPASLIVPTNYSFLLRDDLTERVYNTIDKIESLEIKIVLSASVDGKYMDKINRPFRDFKRVLEAKSDLYRPETDIRDDLYYKKLFDFNVKYDFGFHPMLYSHGIEKWKDNFLWFQNMFEKYNIPFYQIYILEVRNEEWSQKQLEYYSEFIDFLIKWTWENKVDRNIEKFMQFLFTERGYNILTNSIYKRSRGTSCGLQTTMYVRAGDLAIVGCHRQSYNGYEFGKFIVENDKIVDIEAKNIEFALAMAQVSIDTLPYCERCPLKSVCMGTCNGASLEYMGDSFTPMPIVCELVYRKTIQLIKSLKDINVYDEFLNYLDYEQKEAFAYIWKEIKNEF